MKRLAIFRAKLLPISETFIRQQTRFLGSWKPVLVGTQRVPNGLALDGIDHTILPRRGRFVSALRSIMTLPAGPVVRALRELDVRFVHAHFATDAVDVWPSARAAGLPLLVTLHGFDINTRQDWWESGRAGPVMRTYPRRLRIMALDPAVRFIAVSNALKERAVGLGIPQHKIDVSYIGVDTQLFTPNGLSAGLRSRRILFVGRMVEKKAPLLLVRAFASIRTHIPDAELVMIGEGPLLEEVRKLATTLHVPVTLPGPCSAEAVIGHLNQARVLCLPSVTAANGDAEGFGLAILEAQACGVPVVTSALGGATEGLVSGKTGDCFPEGDQVALESCLTRWLLDEHLAEAGSRAARKFVVENFDIRGCTRNLERAYDALVKECS